MEPQGRMNNVPSLMDLLLPEDIDRMRRPRLAEMLAIAKGSAYLLSSEGEDGDERLTVLIVSAGTWGLITDAPADLERGEDYQIMTLTEGARKSLRTLLGIPEKVRKESTGRPKKYSVEKDGMEIFLAHVYEGQSIKRIALERDMSPTTVQKLLNDARIIAADNLVKGVWSASPDSANYQKNLDVLAWAAQHTTGEKKAACEQLWRKLQLPLESAELAGPLDGAAAPARTCGNCRAKKCMRGHSYILKEEFHVPARTPYPAHAGHRHGQRHHHGRSGPRRYDCKAL